MDWREYKKACGRKGKCTFGSDVYILFLYKYNHVYVSPFVMSFFATTTCIFEVRQYIVY